MKWVLSSLGAFSVLIVVTLVFLVKEGVTIRPQPLIKPTEFNQNFEPIGQHIFLRLFPEFQSRQIIIWRVDLPQNLKEKLIQDTLTSWKTQFNQSPKIFDHWPNELEINECQKKCWIILNSKSNFEDIRQKLVMTQFKWLQIKTSMIVNLPQQISKECELQKILDENCIQEVSPYLVYKKISRLNKSAFFMHKYLDNDFYLFVHEIKN
ncbi:MAG: hypothetical protein ACK5V3_04425 [Bdellovibrionales bacterium]